MPWDNSPRRKELPPNWHRLRGEAKERAGGQCEHPLRDGGRCPSPGTDAHHPDRNNHTRLVWLCAWHHNRITQQQAADARRQRQQQASKPKHPGLR